MSREIVKAKLDVVFKKLFTSDNDVLKAFIGDILDIPTEEIKKIEVLNPNILPAAIDGKQSQLDLNMLVDDKTVNVEIQLQNKGDYRDRAVYYWSKLYSDQLKRGELYKELKRTITINILDFDLFTDSGSPYSSFSLLENNRHEPLTDKCSINFFELVKVDAKIDKNNRKQLWLQLIKAETEEDLTMLTETGVPEIQKAVVILHQMSADEEMQEIARLREKAIRDEESAKDYYRRTALAEGLEEGMRKGMEKGIEKGRAEGREEGRAEGKENERQETIERMRRAGFTEDQIKAIYNS